MLSRAMVNTRRRDFWQKVVREFRARGITQRELAAKHGVTQTSMRRCFVASTPSCFFSRVGSSVHRPSRGTTTEVP